MSNKNIKSQILENYDMPAWILDLYAAPASMLCANLYDSRTK